MRNLYYLIWADAISSFRKHNPERNDWKFVTLVFISWMQALNFWIILLWLKYFNIYIPKQIEIDIFPGDSIDGFLSFSAQFALPFVILNYFLIFYKKRYEKILIKYNNIKIRYVLIYCFSMIGGAFLSAVIYGIIK